MARAMTTAFYTHEDCLLHALEYHPERPERLKAIMSRLRDTGVMDELDQQEPAEAGIDQLMWVHPRPHVEYIELLNPAEGVVQVDQDTYVVPDSYRAARLAAGACIESTQRVMSGSASNAFCAVRPPGHHAEVQQAMGFCLFNNVALAAEAALQHDGIDRVAILDFDVHHCNGTVDIFKSRPEVLVCSSFQYPFYPDRYLDFRNEHIVITPLTRGSGSYEFREAVDTFWFPAIESHRPDFIFISAGFDAHRDDPIGELNLTVEDFRWVTRSIVALAKEHAAGRIVSTLEGGYDLHSLSESVDIHIRELLAA